MKRLIASRALIAVLTAALFPTGCASKSDREPLTVEGLAEKNGIAFPDALVSDGMGAGAGRAPVKEPNYVLDETSAMRMRVAGSMEVYAGTDSTAPAVTLEDGEYVILSEPKSDGWMTVSTEQNGSIGYTKNALMHSVPEACGVYAEVPIEYGMAKDNSENYCEAYSHLVDVRRYFDCFSSTTVAPEDVDWDKYDMMISMKLSTYDTTINEPFYYRNLALLQYDMIPRWRQALEKFAADGYKVIIYDAYRPRSVQQKWFDVVGVHEWVANPKIGYGGVHARGTAVDMSLVDVSEEGGGKELEFATPVHTFTFASSRNNPDMSEEARANMDYLTDVMISCGFVSITSEWWHYQAWDTKLYLPADYAMDDIPLVATETDNRS